MKAKVDLLSHTNMVDFMIEVYGSLYGEGNVPESELQFFLSFVLFQLALFQLFEV